MIRMALPDQVMVFRARNAPSCGFSPPIVHRPVPLCGCSVWRFQTGDLENRFC